ncbi:10007_t:CDS:2 [Entrophospora sp. SA101]|nr:10007_t:CDS:2 [Entrophospora sp. SA101]
MKASKGSQKIFNEKDKHPYLELEVLTISHNHCLISDILKEKRSRTSGIMKRCWYHGPENRLTTKEIWNIYYKSNEDY